MSASLRQRVSAWNKRRQTPAQEVIYTDYRMTHQEYAVYLLRGIGVITVFAYFFYRSCWAVLILSPYLFYYLKQKRQELCDKRKQELCMQFKEMILSLSTCLYAGYSVENAFREVYKDMRLLYGEDSLICREIRHIVTALNHNAVLERLLLEFGERSGVPDICEFAEIFAIGKRSGGDLKEIIYSSASVIGEKIEIKRDIKTIISAKVLEQKIMRVVPFGIIGYISVTSHDFFTPLYHNTAGILIMTGCLLVYLASDYLAGKIVAIEV